MKRDILVWLIILFITVTLSGELMAEPPAYADKVGQQPEYHVKLVFIFNFLKFCTWPENKRYGDWIIGVVGKDPFEDEESWRLIKGRKLNGREITYVRFKDGDCSIGDMKKCHVIYTRSLDKNGMKSLGEKLKGSGTLFVTDNQKLEDTGGMINLINTVRKGYQKITFEVNLEPMNREGIRIRLSVLKLAGRVIGGRSEAR